MSMYSVGDHEGHYTPNSHYLHQPPTLSSSASILNYDPSSPQNTAAADHGHSQDYQEGQYKREPTTPTCPSMSHSEFSSYPTPFTPSPSLSGSESPSTPAPYYQPAYPTLEGGERISIPFPAPTPPLSATHLGKDHHGIPETEMKFSKEQVDCICDSLQQRKDMDILGTDYFCIIDIFMALKLFEFPLILIES